MSYLPKRHPAYQDHDTIWFGKFKGEHLEDVPSSYLKWWFDENHSKYKGMDLNLGNIPTYHSNIMLYNYIYNVYQSIEQDLKGDREE